MDAPSNGVPKTFVGISFKAMKEIPTKVFGIPFEGASDPRLENNPALLGVGYIIGPRISALMMGGGVLSYLVLIPAIKYFAPPEPCRSRLKPRTASPPCRSSRFRRDTFDTSVREE